MPSSRSFFLELPTELRLHIYDFALSDSDAITITSAAVAGDDPTEKDYIPRTSIPGLPPNHIPLIRSHYDPSLLSTTNSIAAPVDLVEDGIPRSAHHQNNCLPHPTTLALLQTSHQIHAELSSHLRVRRLHTSRGGLSLYLSYPYGLLVIKALYPTLLRQARCVYISGYYTLKSRLDPHLHQLTSSSSTSASPYSADSSSSRTSQGRGRLRLRLPSPQRVQSSQRVQQQSQPHSATTTSTAHTVLGTLVRRILPPTPAPLFRKLEMRIFYPDESAYSSVWGDEQSPIVEALRNICGGNIDMEVWRGRRGSGVLLVARPNPTSRIISTIWRRLGNSREESEGFVVGGTWPDE